MYPSFVRRFQLWWEHIRSRRRLEDSTSFAGIATPFIPIVKMCFHPLSKIRAVYAICSILMFICIICMLSITINNYLSHKTIFRVDQIAVTEGVQPPDITICLDEHRTTRALERKLKIPPLVNWGILQGVTIPCRSGGKITWDSELHSVSTYIRAVAHFNVTLVVTPPGDISLTVTEQVPIPPDHICTTFKVNHSCFGGNQFWKILHVAIQKTAQNSPMSGQVKVIAHEANGFPLDNYPRYLYESFSPGTTSFIFYSKSLQYSYTNRNRPCQTGPINVQGHTYDYDQAACQWKKTCEYLHNECNCYCPLEFLRSWGRGHFLDPTKDDFTREDCIHSCLYEQQIMLMDAAVCPYACNTATYQRNNKMENHNATTQDSIQVSFVQEDAVTQNTEEELFGLAKLFSEVGGLSSFFFGFSCLVIFELLESCYRFWNRWIRRRSTRIRKEKNISRLSKSIALCRGESYAPHCVPNSEDSPIFPCKNVQRMRPVQESLPPTDCDLSVLLDIDGTTIPVSIQ